VAAPAAASAPAAAAREAQDSDSGTLWPEPAMAAALARAEEELGPIAAPQPTIRIIDPSVAEDEAVDEPELYLDTRREPTIQPPRGYAQPEATEVRRPPPANPLPNPHIPEKTGGFLSLFGGRQRYEAPAPTRPMVGAPPTRVAQGGGAAAAAAAAQAPEPEPLDAEDLDIPSFLRRLAN
jgi:cell division protein FtsZ